jgi:hypothetical protein
MVNAVVVTNGVVENTSVAPKSLVVKAVTAAVAVTVKSAATPVVAPIAPETEMVQTTAVPYRDGFVLMHARLEAGVGVSYATNDNAPFVIGITPPTATLIV